MIRIKEEKHLTENSPIKSLESPKFSYVALSQHLGKICVPKVAVGDSIFLGQMIASADSGIFSPIHSPISGKVKEIIDCPHPVMNKCKAIVIENDGQNKSQVTGHRSQDEIDKLPADEIRNIIFESGIVGMGGATFPSHIKLNPPKPVDTFILNCAECEPYLTSDYRLMIEKTDEIIKGLGLVARILKIKSVVIAIEDNKPEAIDIFKNGVRSTEYGVRVLKTQYPQGGEKQLIKNILGREVPQKKLPFEVGVVVHNVATVHAIYEAIYLNKPLYERVVTVSGSILSKPSNLLVRIGTPIKDLIDFCSPLNKEMAKVVIGGPMMGIAQYDLNVPVVKGTSGVVVFSQDEVREEDEKFCFRCSRCVEYCPSGLIPTMIALASKNQEWGLAREYGAMDCIECGLCSYVCPAKIKLVQGIRLAKKQRV